MSRKLILRFCGIVAAFTSFFGNIAHSYRPETVGIVAQWAKTNAKAKFIFVNYMPEIKMSMMLGLPVGIHNVGNYCFLLNCKRESLAYWLEGEIDGDKVNDVMIEDFMKLAEEVRRSLIADQEDGSFF